MNTTRTALSTLTMLFALLPVAGAAGSAAIAPVLTAAWIHALFGLDILHPSIPPVWPRLAEGVAGWTVLSFGLAVLSHTMMRVAARRRHAPMLLRMRS